MDVKPDSVARPQREDRLRVVRPVVEREDLLGDGMQRDEGLDAGLAPLFVDIAIQKLLRDRSQLLLLWPDIV